MKSKELDMLNGSLWDKLYLFALPMAATAILGHLFNAADIAVVGSFTGSESTVAVAAVGANTSLISLIVSFFTGISLGGNVVIARSIGAGNSKAVSKAVHTSVLVSIIGGILSAVIFLIFSKPILLGLQVPEEVLPYALLYLRIYLLGLPVILLYNFEASIFRSVGDTKTPLVVLTLAGVLNIILNLVFVIGLKMTVNGVAWATVISNALSALVLWNKLVKSDSDIKLSMDKLKIDKDILVAILKIGVPSGVQSGVFSVANIVVQSAINSLGTLVMAASSAAMNLEVITNDILVSFSQACTTFVGQNHGAGKLDRCKKVLNLTLVEGMSSLLATIVILLLVGKNILSLFAEDPQVIDLAFFRLEIMIFAHIFSLLYNTFSGYLRGFGISFMPALLTVISVCGSRIFWIKVVFKAYPKFQTIMAIYPISLALTAVLLFIALAVYRPTKVKKL